MHLTHIILISFIIADNVLLKYDRLSGSAQDISSFIERLDTVCSMRAKQLEKLHWDW